MGERPSRRQGRAEVEHAETDGVEDQEFLGTQEPADALRERGGRVLCMAGEYTLRSGMSPLLPDPSQRPAFGRSSAFVVLAAVVAAAVAAAGWPLPAAAAAPPPPPPVTARLTRMDQQTGVVLAVE